MFGYFIQVNTVSTRKVIAPKDSKKVPYTGTTKKKRTSTTKEEHFLMVYTTRTPRSTIVVERTETSLPLCPSP